MVVKLDAFIEGKQVIFDIKYFVEPFTVDIDGKIYRASSLKKLKEKIRVVNNNER